MIRVLVVDDSSVARELIAHILDADPSVQVIGTCENGQKAIVEAARLNPDAITMDIHMPVMDGFVATRKIMETNPTPIVLVSANAEKDEVATSFLGIEAGALAVMQRPPGTAHPEHAAKAQELVSIVKSMSEVKLVRRWSKSTASATSEELSPRQIRQPIELIVIGASTGGPMALRSILCPLPANFPVPVLVVQHIANGFTAGFSEWLDRACNLKVSLARNGEITRPGSVYIAPDFFHMSVGHGGRISLSSGPAVNGLRPAISTLFRSAADSYGDRCAGILLTGMGRDGADELLLLHERGAVTIAQDEVSSVIYGMPGEAIKLGAAKLILAPEEIAATLTKLASNYGGDTVG